MMINPYTSKRTKLFHVVLSLTLYVDIIFTSLLMGSWEFQTNKESDILDNKTVFTVIIII